MNCISKRNRITTTSTANVATNWRQANQYGFRLDDDECQTSAILDGTTNKSNTKKRGPKNLFSSSNFIYALLITLVIIFTQLFIVHHYVGSSAKRQRLFGTIGANREANLLTKSSWFCHSFPHLNLIAKLAQEFQVELVVVDPDLLRLLVDDDDSEWSGGAQDERHEFSYSGKISQEPSHKTIVHLAAINETSGGQPNLKLFYNALKEHYHMLKYHDASETMAAEVYKRQPHQLDDVQLDAIQDSGRLEQHELQQSAVQMVDFEISKIYTEFMAHVFILNTTTTSPGGTIGLSNKWGSPSVKCLNSVASNGHETTTPTEPFIVVHLFVLYNYEFRPADEWIQSSLLLDEMDRHKLLAYGVHSIDFRVPLEHYYIHQKQKTSTILEATSFKSPLALDRPMNRLKILEPYHRLDYANNTYLHCKPSSFNISALVDGYRRMSGYLRALDAAKPLKSSKYRAMLLDQLSIAIRFMDVFSKSYGNFSYWLTGSTLLAYHKFCQLIALTQTKQKEHQLPETTGADNDALLLLSIDDYEEEVLNSNTMLEFELGLFESELNSSMLTDLSQAKMIGVTMISDWHAPNKNSLVSFHVKDCPNLMFNLHFYKLEKDFYQKYYVTKDNMLYNHKFRRRKPPPKGRKLTADRADSATMLDTSAVAGHHVFSTRNLQLCWTRLDHLEPFRVPCDVHDHLRRIYVI